MLQGKFIVIEGLEGAGKTTAIKTVASVLTEYGVNDQVMTREPGGTKLAESIRQLIKHGVDGELLNATAELLMFYAARVQLVESVIKPALRQGKWVIGDRHDLSTQAYQGGGRQLDQTFIVMLKKMVLGDFNPDLTFYLDLPPELGLERAKQRGKLDHFELQSVDFFRKTRDRYLELAKNNGSIIIIDAAKSLDQVTLQIKKALSSWLKTKVK